MSLKLTILTLLSQKAQTGYEIVKTFDSAVGYFWHASHQQVYRELGSLSKDGFVTFDLIEQDDKPDKKIYRISTEGQQRLLNWLETPLAAPKNKDALLVKLLNTNAENKDILLSELNGEILRVQNTLNQYNAINDEYYAKNQWQSLATVDKMLYLALKKGLLNSAARLQWLDEAVATVKSIE